MAVVTPHRNTITIIPIGSNQILDWQRGTRTLPNGTTYELSPDPNFRVYLDGYNISNLDIFRCKTGSEGYVRIRNPIKDACGVAILQPKHSGTSITCTLWGHVHVSSDRTFIGDNS